MLFLAIVNQSREIKKLVFNGMCSWAAQEDEPPVLSVVP